MKKEITEVVFRKDKMGVFAVFPYLPWNRSGTTVAAYAHVGQHFGCCYDYAILDAKPAKPDDYGELANELTNIGYNLRILKRASRKRMLQARLKHREFYQQLERAQLWKNLSKTTT